LALEITVTVPYAARRVYAYLRRYT